MKNIILVLSCLILFSGCVKKDTRVPVQFASWGSQSEIEILKPILLDFEKENPDIKVDFMHIPQNYFQKIHLLFASNTAPDVIFINNLYLPVYANVLEPLERPEMYYEQALNAMTWHGNFYAVPRDISNLIIYYNKDMFRSKKIPYPQRNWNFDDFLSTAQKLTDKNTFGINFEENPMFYLPFLMSNGGGILPDEIQNPISQKYLNFYFDLRNKYHVAPRKEESASATMAQMFLQERLGMYLSGRWMVPKFRETCTFDWDVINFPNGTNGSIVPLDSSGWAISKTSKHKPEAKRLIDYLSSKSSIEKFIESGLIVPARIDVEKAFLDNKKPKNSKIFLDIIKTSKPTPVTSNYREIVDNLQKETEKTYTSTQN